MSRSFGPSEGMKYPSSREGGRLAGHEYPSSALHSHYYRPPAYPPNSHEYHSTASPHGTLPPPPYATAYSGYEMTGYGGPPTSFDSNGSPHPPQSGGPYPPHHHGYMASYPPPYFAGPWTVVPPPTLIIDITPGDILCGRGGATNAHSGNRAFRSLVKDHQEKYLNAKKRDKPSVASNIVKLIREKGGRFLRRYDTDHTGQVRWVDIGDDRAREKTCQALRENAPELRKRKLVASSSEEDEKPSKLAAMTPHMHSPLQPPDASQSTSTQQSLPTPTRTFAYRTTATTDETTTPRASREGEEGPIMVRPYARLLPAPVDPIPLDQLSPQDRALYLQDFLPPCPPLRPKTSNTTAPQSRSPSLPWPILSI